MSKHKKHKSHRKRTDSLPVHGITVTLPPEFGLSSKPIDKTIREISLAIVQAKRSRPQRHTETQIGKDEWAKIAASIATNAWRAKTRMVDPDTGEAKEEMRRVCRHIEAIIENLKQLGVETMDPVGRTYDPGMALKVVSFEQTPGLSKEEIKETIKPSVSWQGHLIQMGEVIVGTPVASEMQKGEKHEQNDH